MSTECESYAIRNCPFCDEEVNESHFIVHHQLVYPPGRMVLLLALTCVHALPAERQDSWEPYTLYVTERVETTCPGYETKDENDSLWN